MDHNNKINVLATSALYTIQFFQRILLKLDIYALSPKARKAQIFSTRKILRFKKISNIESYLPIFCKSAKDMQFRPVVKQY